MHAIIAAALITPHSFLSLNWDEWGSIFAVMMIIVGIIRWTLKRLHQQLFGPVIEAINDLHKSVDKFSTRLVRSEDRLEKGDKLFIRHDEELKDHERRITHLEEHTNEY